MIAVDTNVLVNAHREGLAHHDRALSWLRALAVGPIPWGLPVFCIGEFVRVTTHARILSPPSTIDQAWAAIEAILASPTVRVLSPGPRYATLLKESILAADARGNLAFDAQIAAVCQEQGASRLLTLDRDFDRLRSLTLVGLESGPPGVEPR